MAGRFKELLKKYGKVALGVHFSVSAASITGLYIAIKNNVDVESILEKWHLPGVSSEDSSHPVPTPNSEFPESQDGGFATEDRTNGDGRPSAMTGEQKKRNRTAELATSTGGALALAVLCNKALLPVRIPITIALTPPVSRFLARNKIIKNGV